MVASAALQHGSSLSQSAQAKSVFHETRGNRPSSPPARSSAFIRFGAGYGRSTKSAALEIAVGADHRRPAQATDTSDDVAEPPAVVEKLSSASSGCRLNPLLLLLNPMIVEGFIGDVDVAGPCRTTARIGMRLSMRPPSWLEAYLSQRLDLFAPADVAGNVAGRGITAKLAVITNGLLAILLRLEISPASTLFTSSSARARPMLAGAIDDGDLRRIRRADMEASCFRFGCRPRAGGVGKA